MKGYGAKPDEVKEHGIEHMTICVKFVTRVRLTAVLLAADLL